MGHIARQNDDASGRICLQLFRIELLAQADVENTRDYYIDPVLRCRCGISLTQWGTRTLIV
jgi:hypothetical protein